MISLLAEMITAAEDIVYYMRIQNYHEGSIRFRAMLGQIQQSNELCVQLKDILSALMEALECDDEILMADLLEDGLLPMLKGLLEEYGFLSQPGQRGEYQWEQTAVGIPTVKHIPSNLYLHSNNNPLEEARILVEKCFDMNKSEYVVWGSGLGYHIFRLYEYSRGAIPIKVFEESEELLRLAFEKGVLSQIPADRLSCEVDANGYKFAAYIQTHKAGILLHLPSIKKIRKPELRDVMKDFFASWNGTIQFKEELAINYRSNITACTHYVDELENLFLGKEVIIVGGGPSLDENIDFLREQMGKSVIVAVTTVWHKLLNLGMKPDAVFVMDSQKRTFGHMKDVTDTKTPLILDSTAYWEFASKYQGPKYIVCQSGYPAAEKLAQKKGLKIYETGGTVVSLALDVVLKLGTASVSFVGVDLAYPEGKSHASGTMDEKMRDLDTLFQVKAQDGSVTYTDKLFDMYRRWIEHEIKKYPKVQFCNLAQKGAYIEGTTTWKNK